MKKRELRRYLKQLFTRKRKRRDRRPVKTLAIERLEDRIVLSGLPSVGDVGYYETANLLVGGGDDTTGIAIINQNYGTTDAFGEVFEIREIQAPNTLTASIGLNELRNLHGVPGSTSGGPDGMTSVTGHNGFWYVMATSEGTDAIFKIAADGSSSELYSNIEIFHRADSFNHSEIEFFDDNRAFLARSGGLTEIDGNGQFVRDLATGDFNGVATIGNALFAVKDGGALVADFDVTDGNHSPSFLMNMNKPIADLTYGSFGTLGDALFVATKSGDVGYWEVDRLFNQQPLTGPQWLFNIPGFLGKINFQDGDLYASLSEDALRIQEHVDFAFEVVESEVTVTEGAGPTAAIRLHLTGAPNQPLEVSLAKVSGDGDITVIDDSFVFDEFNWRADAYPIDYANFQAIAGALRLEAAADADALDGQATIRITAPGLDPLDITVTEHDKDGALEIELKDDQVTVHEGHTATFQVRLTAAPTAPVTLQTQHSGGDADLFVEAHSQVTFDETNWDRWQWVSLGANADSDSEDTATFSVSAAGLTAQTVSATAAYDTGQPVTYEILVDDYQTLSLQGETHDFALYNRLRGDRGKVDPHGTVEFRRGEVEATVTDPAGGFAGVFNSVNHTLLEGLPLDFNALLPAQIMPEYQYRATAIKVEVLDGQGELKIELKDSNDVEVWSELVLLNGGPQPVEVAITDPPSNVQLLNWLIVGDENDFVRVGKMSLVVEGPNLGYLEAFVWPYASLLANYDPVSGLTRDRAAFPAGAFDGTNTSGGMAAATALAAELGIISQQDAAEIVAGTANALLDLQASASINGVMPHFIRSNFVIDNETGNFDVISGTWTEETAGIGYYGENYLTADAGSGESEAQWTIDIVRQGQYEIFTRWVEGGDRATNTPFTIHHDGGSTTVHVDQQQVGDQWVSLGQYTFSPGQNAVTVSNDASGVVIADSLRLEGPPHIVPNTEYASIDSIIGLLGTLLASESLGLPTASLENAIQQIDWQALTHSDGTISHGYHEDGTLLSGSWDFFGGESLMMALAYAASTGSLPNIPIDPNNLQSFNGSGFIDELLWVFVDSIDLDAHGADWAAFRPEAAANQIAHYDRQPTPMFGASAAEPPIPSQFPVAPGDNVSIPYFAYGVDGAFPGSDGSEMFVAPVAAPHYAGMISSLEPEAAARMWDELRNQGILTPLNLVETVVVQQWGGDLETHAHAFKGSWNLALWALGTGRQLLDGNNPLFEASRSNNFLSAGMDLISGESTILAEQSAEASLEYLRNVMDEYHTRFPVYEDVSSAGNHFHAWTKIPDENAAININGSSTDEPHAGATAIRVEFTDTNGTNHAGFYFQNGVLTDDATTPEANWGEVPDAGTDLTGATTLTFWARGEQGGEKVEFFIGGVGRDPATGDPTAPYPDSSPRHPGVATVTSLTSQWQQYSIDVSGLDLSYVLGGFGFVLNAPNNPGGAVFYLDDIQFELNPSAQQSRLNQPRLLRSFTTLDLQPDPFDENTDDDIDLVLRNSASSYDNALAILAFLADGSPDSTARAQLIGDALVYAAQNDRTYDDGRLRSFYAAGDISLPPGWTPNGRVGTVPVAGFYDDATETFFEIEQDAVDTGNNAWAMIALLALYSETGNSAYLDSARDIGEFIQSLRGESGTYQGFLGGIDDPESKSPTVRPWASTEHNLDVVAAFNTMYEITGESQWQTDAEHAKQFVDAMWDPATGHYFTGTIDPETRNDTAGQLPLDVQSWNVLVFPDAPASHHDQVLASAETFHRTNSDGFSGFDFNEDRDGVWFEGTAQMAAAYAFAGQENMAINLRTELRRAQDTAPFGDQQGIAAASRDPLTTGFDFKFFRRLHVAATAWNVFAQLGFNPYYQDFAGITDPDTPDRVGVFRDSLPDGYLRFYIDSNGNGTWDGQAAGDTLHVWTFGDLPIIGDWDGDGVDDIGVYRDSLPDGKRRFYLDTNGNGVWDGQAAGDTLHVWTFGDAPIIGDWDGDGDDDVGVYRDSLPDGKRRFYLDTSGNGVWDGQSAGDTLHVWTFGDAPVIGNWDGDGDDDVGVYRDSLPDGKRRFYLDTSGNGVWDGQAAGDTLHVWTFGDAPVIGDWDGDGDDDVGVFRDSLPDGNRRFYLDTTGNGVWDGQAAGDTLHVWGTFGDLPIIGKWPAPAPLFASGGEASGSNQETGHLGFGIADLGLEETQLQPIVDAAIVRLAASGASAEHLATLSSVNFVIGDLPGALLGLASGNTITLDSTAAGYGWFIDPTPLNDSEFQQDSDHYYEVSQRIDALTVVLHEMLHVLDHGHTDAEHDLMNETLPAGVRRLPTPDELDAVFGDHSLLDEILG